MEQQAMRASDGADVHYYGWLVENAKAAVQIAHGMGEHAKRYDHVAEFLNGHGYAVYANDHRGHGETGRADLGYFGPDGWNRVIADAYEFNRLIAGKHPNLKVVMLGHSMGSMLAQNYVIRHGASIDALALSGSPGLAKPGAGVLPKLIAGFEAKRLGDNGRSDLLQRLLFGGANKPFDGPGANGFEWLSRDEVEVQKYIDDELCGFVVAAASVVDLFNGSALARNARCLDGIPAKLPVYVFSGQDDPVHGGEQGLNRLVEAYRLRTPHLEYRLYPGGRHEMFNETNRAEVLNDLVQWLGSVT